MKGGFDVPISVHLPQPLFQLHLEVHCNIQPVTLVDLFVPIEDDWIQHKPKRRHSILDIITLHGEEERIHHHDSAIEKCNIGTVTLF